MPSFSTFVSDVHSEQKEMEEAQNVHEVLNYGPTAHAATGHLQEHGARGI